MASISFSATQAGYAKLWLSASIAQPKLGAVDKAAKRIIAAKARYLPVEKAAGVPWYFIGALHYRESNLNFTKHLHNGDPLSARTVRVPAGHPKTGSPPFAWEASAIDALKLKSLHKIRDWTVERMLYEAERFNGFGYMGRKGHNSPYVWGGTCHQTPGKYVADGKFNAKHVDSQLGVAAILKRIVEIERDASPPLANWRRPVSETVRQSISLRSLIGGIGVMFAYLSDLLASGIDGVSSLFALLPSAVSEGTSASEAAAAVATWLKLESGMIVNSVALATMLLVFYRETARKRDQT